MGKTRHNGEEVWIVGAGRVGKLIAAGERADGCEVTLFDTEPGTCRLGNFRFNITTGPQSGSPDRLWFCVPDDLLEKLVNEWRSAGVQPKLTLHTSGWHSTELLAPISGAIGDRVSLHPMRSVLGKRDDELAGALISVAGTNRGSVWAKGFCERRKAYAITIETSEKPSLHLICQFAANFPFAIMAAIESLSESTQISRGRLVQAVEEMIIRSTHNAVVNSAAAAATGPVARGDAKTVAASLKALEGNPALHKFYQSYVEVLQEAIAKA